MPTDFERRAYLALRPELYEDLPSEFVQAITSWYFTKATSEYAGMSEADRTLYDAYERVERFHVQNA